MPKSAKMWYTICNKMQVLSRKVRCSPVFQVNDWIVYGTSGVYCIVNTDLPDPTGTETDRRYYELQATRQKCRTYVPMDSSVPMRPVISRLEAEKLIRNIPNLDVALCTDHGKNAAEKYYKDLLQNSDCATILGVVRKLSERRSDLLKTGHHMSYTEEKYLKRGRELLDSEFAIAFGIEPDEVAAFVKKQLSTEE